MSVIKWMELDKRIVNYYAGNVNKETTLKECFRQARLKLNFTYNLKT